MKKLHVLLFSVLIFLFSIFVPTVRAAVKNYYVPSGYYPINTKGVVEGNIISFANNGYFLSSTTYDQYMVGVVTNSPAIIQNITSPVPAYPVISNGEGFVTVSSINGAIKTGDFITSSKIPGVGMKSTAPGYTLGVALQDFSASNAKTIGKIPIRINIHYYIQENVLKSGLANVANLTMLAAYQSPGLVFKYLVVAGIVGLSLFFSFILITRTANKGIDALGRNPLSTNEIHIGIALNVGIAIIILVAGFVMGILVLRL